MKDYTGLRFNRLLVVSLSHCKASRSYWNCLCDCGNEVVVQSQHFIRGHTKSCGCLQREAAAAIRRTHGMYLTAEYGIWRDMKQRCLDPNSSCFYRYGGRGITVCDAWQQSFEIFYESMGPRPSAKHSLDRIDNNGPYSPENCRWATNAEQSSNTRRNQLVTFEGKTKTITEWANELGIRPSTLNSRLCKYNWTVEEALTTPVTKRNHRHRT